MASHLAVQDKAAITQSAYMVSPSLAIIPPTSPSGNVTSTLYLPLIHKNDDIPRFTNLLANGTFESGNFDGWENPANAASITSADFHGGTRAAQLNSASIRTQIPTTPDQTYKVTAWVHIANETDCPGCWGGMRLAVYDQNWHEIGHSGYLLMNTHGSTWFKVAFTFVAESDSTTMEVGYFGDSQRMMMVNVDDLMAFEKPAVNTPPTLTTVSLTPVVLNTLPQNQQFAAQVEDYDGAIERIVWDFGDGVRSLAMAGEHRVALPGVYTATVQISDDDGGVTEGSVTWSATASQFSNLTVTSPSTFESTINTPLVTLNGTTTGNVTTVQVSSDRGQLVTATGTASWSAGLPLQPGMNRLLVQARSASGRVVSLERLVRYVPVGVLGILNPVLPANVERWEPLQITFALANSAATHPQFPYNPNMPPGLEWVEGVSVEGLFTPDNWATVYRRPAFLYQPYQRALKRNEEWLYPQGSAVWVVRFAPPSAGNWKYRIEAREARGTAQSNEGTFTVTSPANLVNHGPVRVSPNDSRYFEFADGTPFLGSGYNIGFSAERFSYEAEERFVNMGLNNEHFFRWWLGGNLWASAWQPWNSRTLSYDGYIPANGLTVDRAYGKGLAALRLDDANPVMIYGFMSGHPGLIPGHTYRFRVRWRTEGLTGPATAGQPYGATLKLTGWFNNPYHDTLQYPALIPHVNGDTPWHVAEGTFVAGSDFPAINNSQTAAFITVARENATGGAVYVDAIELYEDLGQGRLGPQLLRNANFNSHLAFDERRAFGIDAILAAANTQGKYFKLVISEKNEFLINHLGPDGLPDRNGNHFNEGPGTPTNWLHQAYWRYLFARYGAYRSVHSWELVNEAAPEPGQHFQLTGQLAALAAADGNPHLATTSTWSSLAEDAWKAPYSAPISYVDFHAYVLGTGWLEPRDELADDSARFFNEYDLAARTAGFGKPVVWGEQGIDGHNDTDHQDPQIPNDTAGVWLHKMVWVRGGPGGVYPLYWYSDVIWDNSLHAVYGAWHTFMIGIPLTNGRYEDVAATISNPNLRVVGQKDLQARWAHVWIDNRRHTWRAVVNGQSIPTVSGTVQINLQQPNAAYTVTWYSTQTGASTSTQNLIANGNGVVTLTVTNLQTDTAARIVPR